MASEARVAKAVEAGILASAHLAALERVTAAAFACQRLGSLSSGRWRAAARELDKLEESLSSGFTQVSEDVARHAEELDVPEEALWTIGDAAGLYDLFEEEALEEVDEDSNAAVLLEGDALFGVTFVEDPDSAERGSTLLFGWADPLQPAVWSWEATWLAGALDDEDEPGEDEPGGPRQLDLAETAAFQVSDALVRAVAERLEVERETAVEALKEVAAAFTRASLLAALGGDDEDEADDETENGQV